MDARAQNIKQTLNEIELAVRTGEHTIKKFADLKKRIRGLQRKAYKEVKKDGQTLGLKLFYQACMRRLKELQAQISSEVLQIPISNRGYGLRRRPQAATSSVTDKPNVIWQEVSLRVSQ